MLKNLIFSRAQLLKNLNLKFLTHLKGNWNIPSYDITYTFNADGTFIADMYGSITYEGVYTYDNEKITVTYYADSEATIDIPYAFDGNNTLVMNGMGYYRMNDDGSLVATPDQA